jgi:uncharacterized protein YjiS (DUF1127 family)
MEIMYGALQAHPAGANERRHAVRASKVGERFPHAVALHRYARAMRARLVGVLVAAALRDARKLLRRLRTRYHAYRIERETYHALSSLDDRTLHDLGYHRSQIESVAVEVAASRARAR